MAVYVDDMNMPFRRMKMSHMVADSTEELVNMAKAIGVNLKWIQYPGTPKEHFDICLSMKAKAIELGAVQITWRQLGEMTMKRIKDSKDQTSTFLSYKQVTGQE